MSSSFSGLLPTHTSFSPTVTARNDRPADAPHLPLKSIHQFGDNHQRSDNHRLRYTSLAPAFPGPAVVWIGRAVLLQVCLGPMERGVEREGGEEGEEALGRLVENCWRRKGGVRGSSAAGITGGAGESARRRRKTRKD